MAGEKSVVEEKDAAASDGRKLSEPGAARRRPPSTLLRKAFICSFPDCDAIYNRAWKLDAHLLRHTGELPFVCNYEDCGKGFTRLFHLKRHFLTHTGEKPFVCSVEGCNEKFTTKSNLNKHVGRKHLQHSKEYICDFEGCGKSFKKHQQLKIHQSEHTGEPPFKCSHEGCGMGFSMRAHLKRHEKIHEGYACKKDGCSFVGKTWSELLKHMRQSHVEPITCSVCGKIFRRKDYLKCHQKIHAAEREVLKCPREGCGRTYTTLFNLQSHIVSFHEARRSFTCSHPGCGRVFAMKQSLVRHGVVHDPDKRKLNSNSKKPRPKRSLASHLSGFIPPKACRRDVSSVEKTLITPEASAMLPTVETLSLG